MKEAADNGKKISQYITRTLTRERKTETYLVVQLINSSKKDINESVKDYVIRTETILSALRIVG